MFQADRYFFAGYEMAQRLTDDIVGARSSQPVSGRVRRGDGAAKIGTDDDVRHGLEQAAIPLLSAAHDRHEHVLHDREPNEGDPTENRHSARESVVPGEGGNAQKGRAGGAKRLPRNERQEREDRVQRERHCLTARQRGERESENESVDHSAQPPGATHYREHAGQVADVGAQTEKLDPVG